MGAFAGMSGDVSRICDIIAMNWRGSTSRTTTTMLSAPRACTGSASSRFGQTAHRGWARLLLDRARDLIIHGPAHRGANGAAMPTDADDQDGHFFYNHPERVAA